MLMKNCQERSRVDMITLLPDDVLLNCLARVSRLYYPILSLVSKRLRSLIASLELYQTRTILGQSESCLYVCLRFCSSSNPRWFTLCRRPTRSPNRNLGWFTPCFRQDIILKNRIRKRLSNNLMVSVPASNLSAVYSWTYGAIGSNIYTIAKNVNGTRDSTSSRVFYLDCRSQTWHEAPSKQMNTRDPHMSVLDGKLYVVEQWNVSFSNPIEVFDPKTFSNPIEVFDPKTQLWEYVTCPIAEILGTRSMLTSFAIDGKLYLYGDKCMVYKPKENKWDVVGYENHLLWARSGISCVINNIIYSSKRSRVLKWYDSQGRIWRDLEGLEELPKLPTICSCLRLVNYGGKIAVLWEKSDVFSRKKMIWCAVIAVERRNEQEIYGKIELCDVVLTVPRSCCVLEFFSVTV